MGQKVNPISLRLQVNKDWQSKWFSEKDYAKFLVEDIKLRRAAETKLGKRAGVARIDIERSPNLLVVTVYTAKPGVVIGRGGSGAEELKAILSKIAGTNVKIAIEEVKRPEANAALVAENVAGQLERRISFRRAMKMSVENALKAGAAGAKVMVAGRLNGAEMSRRESFSRGSIPLHTIRANVEFSQALAHTTYGIIGVKVWVYKGEEK